jgi:hypothetical protein
MAFGTSSKMFVAFIEAALENQAAYNLSSDAIKVALFNNSITAPDATAALASISFGTGVWAANEVFDGAEWPTGGQQLDTVTSAIASNVWTFDAANEVSTGTSATLADVRGCLVYDDTVADVGICFLSFGGANAVTDGTFTVQFAGTGIATITV